LARVVRSSIASRDASALGLPYHVTVFTSHRFHMPKDKILHTGKRFLSRSNPLDLTCLFGKLEPLTDTEYDSYDSDPGGPFPSPVHRGPKGGRRRYNRIKSRKLKAELEFKGFQFHRCHRWKLDNARRFLTSFSGNSRRLEKMRVQLPPGCSPAQCLYRLRAEGYDYVTIKYVFANLPQH
jgi:hypothetical protein